MIHVVVAVVVVLLDLHENLSQRLHREPLTVKWQQAPQFVGLNEFCILRKALFLETFVEKDEVA